MESLSQTERAALCNTALETGEDAPTLCEGWDVKDLVIHLLVRERDLLAAPGIMIPQLGKLTERASRKLEKQDFTALVERIRNGPPLWSPMALPPVDRTLNSLEYFVHHEDIRRAQPGWAPRELTDREQRTVFKAASFAGKGLVKPAGVPVEIRWADAEKPRSTVLAGGEDPVVISGDPSELAMYLFGRKQHRALTFDGPADKVTKLEQGMHSL
jgi:uncharacterized protein (TIGR03085 family)